MGGENDQYPIRSKFLGQTHGTTDNIDKPGCHEIEKTRPVVPMSVNPGKIELNSFGIQRQVDATH